MSERGDHVLEQALQLLELELTELRIKKEAIQAEVTQTLAPLERRIAQLEAARAHQIHAITVYQAADRPASDKPVMTRSLLSLAGRKFTDVAATLLEEAGKPLHYRTLAEEMMRAGVSIAAKDPGSFVISYLRREPDRFCRAGASGEYALVEWNLPDARPVAASAKDTIRRRKART